MYEEEQNAKHPSGNPRSKNVRKIRRNSVARGRPISLLAMCNGKYNLLEPFCGFFGKFWERKTREGGRCEVA